MVTSPHEAPTWGTLRELPYRLSAGEVSAIADIHNHPESASTRTYKG